MMFCITSQDSIWWQLMPLWFIVLIGLGYGAIELHWWLQSRRSAKKRASR